MTIAIEDIRPEVLAFARLMEAKLREHDPAHPEGWKDAEPFGLATGLHEHAFTLAMRLAAGVTPAQTARDIADCLNYLMMIADVTGVLEGFRDGEARVPDAGAADGQAGQVAPHPAG
jgi:hypothetical protein